jgi:hypothetical protein
VDKLFLDLEEQRTLAAKRTPLKHNLRTLFTEKKDDGKGLEFFISQSSRTAKHHQTSGDPAPGNIVWDRVLERIKKKSNPQVFFWFAPLKPVSETEDSITLRANSQQPLPGVHWRYHKGDLRKDCLGEDNHRAGQAGSP